MKMGTRVQIIGGGNLGDIKLLGRKGTVVPVSSNPLLPEDLGEAVCVALDGLENEIRPIAVQLCNLVEIGIS